MDTPFDRRRPGPSPRVPRPLRRVQPALRPRHLVRPQDRRQRRRDPDEPAPAGEVEVSYDISSGPEAELRRPCRHAISKSDGLCRGNSTSRHRRWSSLSLQPISKVPQPEHYRELVPPRRRALAVVLAPHARRCASRRDHPASEGRALLRASTRAAATSACSSSISASRMSASSRSSAWSRSYPARATAAGSSPRRLDHAWRDGVSRVHVHTCSLDHPAALPAYRRAGFIALQARGRALPRPAPLGNPAQASSAPQVPLLGTEG